MAAFPCAPIARLTGHGGPVHAVAYSSGAQTYILTGSSDRTIRLFNPQKAPPTSAAPPSSSSSSSSNPAPPGLVTKYTAHGYEVLSLHVNAANDRFVSTGGDKTVFLWDVQTGQTVRRWTGHAGRVNRGVFGGDSDALVVTGSFDGAVKVWDVRSNAHKPVMTLSDAKDAVTDVAVHDSDIVAASVDGRVRCYNVRVGRCDVDVIGPPCTSLCISKKGTEVLVSSLDSSVRLMDRTNGECLKKYEDPAFVNRDLRVRSTLGLNDGVVVSGSDDGSVLVWDVLGGVCLHRFRHCEMREVGSGYTRRLQVNAKKDVVSAVAFCTTRREWCSAGGDGNVVVWGMARETRAY